MTTIKEKSKNYYMYFNIPIHFLCIVSFFFVDDLFLTLSAFFLFYIVIYWFGIQAGFHKLFAHRTWIPKNAVIKNFIAVVGCYGLMGGPIVWAQIHRMHHAKSDTLEDPHTPSKGKLYAYFLWLLDLPNISLIIVKDLLKDEFLAKINNNSKMVVLVPIFIFYFISINITCGLLLACIATFHSEMSINAFLHKKIDGVWGAVNNVYLSSLSGGSTLHKNHHDNIRCSNLAANSFEFDASYLFIKFFQK